MNKYNDFTYKLEVTMKNTALYFYHMDTRNIPLSNKLISFIFGQFVQHNVIPLTIDATFQSCAMVDNVH